MSFFFDEDDPETERMRRLIAADYTDSGSDNGSDSNIDIDDAEDIAGSSSRRIRGGSSRLRFVDEDEGDINDLDSIPDVDMNTDDSDNADAALLDPSLRSGGNSSKGRLRAGFGRKSGAGSKKKKGKGSGGVREQEPSEEVKILLGQANQAYATDDLEEAERLLAEVIRIDNHVYAAWKTLGEIHKQRGDIPKCLLAWISAGHLRLKDGELWSICGKLSVQIGQVDQALYCYNRAILANGNDVESIFERGLVYKDMGNLAKALESFKKLHDILPHDLTVIKELASVHALQKNIPSAAKLYEDILQASQAPQPTLANSHRSAPPPFGWSELNILAELYGAQKEWLRAIRLIKSTARWLLQRSNERFWNDVADENDGEYFPDRAVLNRHFPASKKDVPESMAAYSLPLDLRAKMAVFRLKLGHINTALIHASYLIAEAEKAGDGAAEGVGRYADLFLDVAEALVEAEQYEQALALYAPLAEIEEYCTSQVVMAMGKCLHGLADFEQAEAAYQTVIGSDHENLDARIALAEVYEATGRRHEALELVNDVMRLRRELERQKNASSAAVSNNTQPESRTDGSNKESNGEIVPSFIPNTESRNNGRQGSGAGRPRTGASAKARSSRSERMQAEEQAALLVETKLRRLRQYQDGLKTGNPVAVAEWLQTASELVDMFNNTKAFFPADKQRVFRGFFATAKRRAGKQTLNDKLQGMATRLQESLQQQPLQEEDEPQENATEFRGLSFDGWFSIFMQYALALTWHEEVEDAYSVLRRARDANVFHQDKERVKIMTLVQLSCSLHVKDYKLALETVRTFISQQETQFNPEMYRLMLCCVPSGSAAAETFNLPGTQKYLLRHVKGMDSLVQGRSIVGSVKIKDHHHDAADQPTEKENTVLLTLYGQILASSRSYVPSLSYYMRAFAVEPRDPMVLFSIALAHLHRSMQRQSNNRHLQIVQGLSYLIDYYRVRIESSKGRSTAWAEVQETNYNMGRAFQMLGLPTLAAQYYERVLAVELPDTPETAQLEKTFSLKAEAAYNLQLVYVLSGNFRLARMIVDKYLVI